MEEIKPKEKCDSKCKQARQMVVDGYSNEDIMAQLGLSKNTVITQRSFVKTGRKRDVMKKEEEESEEEEKNVEERKPLQTETEEKQNVV